MGQNDPFFLTFFEHELVFIRVTLNIDPIYKDMFFNIKALELCPKGDKKFVDLSDFTFETEGFHIILDNVVNLISLKQYSL